MKRNLFAALSLGALSLFLTEASALAQPGLEATVPFAFNVGTTHLPAGTYWITVDSLHSSVRIQNYRNSATILAHAEREYPGKKVDKLVFRQANDQYFLAEIWGEQGSEGMRLRAPYPVIRMEEAKQRWPSGNETLVALK